MAPGPKSPNTGKYQLIKPLATGGMGEIYLARMRGIEGFERLVVLKRLKPDVASRAENIAMFLDEVRLLASIQHANVVRIYDVGTSSDGGFFYAMEYLHGQDLRSVMKVGRATGLPPVSLLVSIGVSVLSGLHHVHERNGPDGKPLQIVHRDVSPANIFITYEGEVKLLDFGIALAASRKTQTEAGVVKGKFRYMSPEQCRTDPLDRRSDVFATGVVLWEMATGKSLFKTDSDVKTLFAIVEHDAPLVSAVVPDFPPVLDQIIAKALRRPVAERWQTAREMQLALEAFALDQKISLSSSPLGGFMAERFAEEIEAWHAAQKAGKDLASFVAEQAAEDTGSGPLTPSASSSSGLAVGDGPPPHWQPPPASWPSGAPQEGTGSIVVTVEPPRRSPLIYAAAAVGLLVLGGLAFALTRPAQVTPAPPPVEQAARAPTVAAPTVKVEPPPPPPTVVEATPTPAPAVGVPVDARPPPVLSRPAARRPAKPAAPEKTEKVDSAPSPAWDKDSPVPPQ